MRSIGAATVGSDLNRLQHTNLCLLSCGSPDGGEGGGNYTRQTWGQWSAFTWLVQHQSPQVFKSDCGQLLQDDNKGLKLKAVRNLQLWGSRINKPIEFVNEAEVVWASIVCFPPPPFPIQSINAILAPMGVGVLSWIQ